MEFNVRRGLWVSTKNRLDDDCIGNWASRPTSSIQGATHGNKSSPAVVYVLDQVLKEDGVGRKPQPGDFGIMLALGPGLAVEGALLEW